MNPKRVLKATRAWARAERRIKATLPTGGVCVCYNCMLLREVDRHEAQICKADTRKKRANEK